MGYYVYILQSQADQSYYVGSSHDPKLRLEHHNDGWSRSTKGKRPWDLIHIEELPTKTDALKRERQIKRMKSRGYIERLLRNAEVVPIPHENYQKGSGSPVRLAEARFFRAFCFPSNLPCTVPPFLLPFHRSTWSSFGQNSIDFVPILQASFRRFLCITMCYGLHQSPSSFRQSYSVLLDRIWPASRSSNGLR